MDKLINNVNLWRAIALALAIVIILNLAVIHKGFITLREQGEELSQYEPAINWLEAQIRLSQPKP